MVKEAVQPPHFKTKIKFKTGIKTIPNDDFVNFSDLCLIATPLRRSSRLPPSGKLYSQLLHLVHAQSSLIADEGIIIRGGITVGKVVKSYRQLFGPAVVRAYELESKIAKNPRIIVDKEVLNELAVNPGLWVHDRRTDEQAVRNLLREDDDGELFVDYLRLAQNELDDPAYYNVFLARHQLVITEGLKRYSQDRTIRAKYEWMDRYHKSTLITLSIVP